MKCADWTRRASQFLRSLTHLPGEIGIYDNIEAAPTDKHTKDWLRSPECSLPSDLKEFVTKASNRCCFSYRWKPSKACEALLPEFPAGQTEITGGGDLCEVARFLVHDHRASIEDMEFAMLESAGIPGAVRKSVGDPEREHGRICILKMKSGDQISVVCKDMESGGEVVFVPEKSPEKAQVISRTFDEFLVSWERVAYITPTPESLKPWLSPKTGLLTPTEADAKRLRQIFIDATNSGRSSV